MTLFSSARRNRKRRPLQRGAALVEFALVAPILFMFFMACIEFSRINMIRNSIAISAYEGARRGIIPGATAAQAEATARASLAATGITPQSVTVSPATLTTSTEVVTVTVTAAGANNLWISPLFSGGMVLTKSASLSREKTSN
ncbi:MAG: pilus assembly protein [Pirellulales bacterium]